MRRKFFWLLLAIIGILPFLSLADNNKTSFQIYSTCKRVTPGPVHDPSTIIKSRNGNYWIFATGDGIVSYYSTDLIHWESGPSVFKTPPSWTKKLVPGFEGIFWAPDVIYLNDEYMLYYAVSTWGSNVSAIGLVTNRTLNPNSSNYHWNDQGPVIVSDKTDDFNAIDPCPFVDPTDNTLWLTFGSFWSGIKLVQLDPSTGKRINNSPVYSLARHRDRVDSIEASYLYYHNGYYYLFVNWNFCCKGIDSTYNIRVGRSTKITGPYLDRDGKNMLDGGGSLFLETEGAFVGPGQVGILHEDNKYLLSCHFYDGNSNGAPTLAILPLEWENGWPIIAKGR